MKTHFPPEWRTQKKWKRRFYSKYMKWLEWLGYGAVVCVLGAFVFAFNYRVDDTITADRVPLRASANVLSADQPTLIVAQVAANFAEVEPGDSVLEVVVGEDAIKRFLAWRGATELGVASAIPRPETTPLKSAWRGTVYVDPGVLGRRLDAGSELAQIRDYAHLVATANLAGNGVAKAKPGGRAVVRSILVEPRHGILIRGQSEQGPLISGQLGGEELRQTIAKSLSGVTLQVRDDLPLQVAELSEVQVDALVRTQKVSDGGVWTEPSPTVELTAEVVSGEHRATVQFAQLSPEIRQVIHAEIAQNLQQPVRTLDGQSLLITGVSDVNTVLKASAVPTNHNNGSIPVPATALSRTFEAQLRIDNPPTYLIEAVRAADRAGKSVTAKIELKTGDRPIATLLLRRS